MSRRRSASLMASSAGGVWLAAPNEGTGRADAGVAAGDVAHPTPHSPHPAIRARLLPRVTRLRPAPRIPLPARRSTHVRLDLRRDDGFDSAPNVEVTRYLHPPWFARRGKIVQDAVDGALVEDPVVPEAPQIELETLELQAETVRHVVDQDRPKVRCTAFELPQLGRVALDAADRTERRELRALHADGVVPIGVRIVEGLQQFWLGHGSRMARQVASGEWFGRPRGGTSGSPHTVGRFRTHWPKVQRSGVSRRVFGAGQLHARFPYCEWVRCTLRRP